MKVTSVRTNTIGFDENEHERINEAATRAAVAEADKIRASAQMAEAHRCCGQELGRFQRGEPTERAQADRAARDAASPAEEEAAETESLAHRIERLEGTVDRLLAQVAELYGQNAELTGQIVQMHRRRGRWIKVFSEWAGPNLHTRLVNAENDG